MCKNTSYIEKFVVLCVTNRRVSSGKGGNQMIKKVKTIEPIRQKVLGELRPKKKVCAYCRVSTDSAKQHTSYVAQTEYYQQYIQSREDWEYVGIFADEAKTATKVKNRDEFLGMIKECEKGNIDIIITKSVTRFARNTVDSIETIRKLKALGISVFFEKKDFDTAESPVLRDFSAP